jgi:hypothetical protein
MVNKSRKENRVLSPPSTWVSSGASNQMNNLNIKERTNLRAMKANAHGVRYIFLESPKIAIANRAASKVTSVLRAIRDPW